MPLGIARHIITYSGSWSPARSITPAFWIDASDASSYSVSGSNVTAVTDKAGNATITVGGTPNTSSSLDSKTVFHFQANNNEDLTTNEFHQASVAITGPLEFFNGTTSTPQRTVSGAQKTIL